MIPITKKVSLDDIEIEMVAIRAQGAGGQNINKVSTAIHLRFDINNSSLPEFYKTRLLGLGDYRISKDGIIIIKAQRFRSQDQNRKDAISRLQTLIRRVSHTLKKRKPTKPSKAVQQRRLESKERHAALKTMRRKVLRNVE